MTFWRELWALTKPYWTSEEKWKARGMGALVVLLNLFLVYATTALTFWNGEQGDSLQQKSVSKFLHSQWMWMFWVTLWIAIYVYGKYYQQLLALRWRAWMTQHFSRVYLSDRTHYFWRFSADASDNPDQRIAEDIDGFVRNFIDLTLGLIGNLTSLITFTIMLWRIGGTPRLPFFGGATFILPGYLVYAAYLWAIGMSLVAHVVGHKLVGLDVEQQRREADFRYSLVRIRENSESIALASGEATEGQLLNARFAGVVGVVQQIMGRNKRVNALYQINIYLGSQISYLVAGPLFFQNIMTLGDLTKVNIAFYYVQNASTFFVNSYAQIAHWQAMIRRLSGFVRTAEEAKALAERAQRAACGSSTAGVASSSLPPQAHLALSNLKLRLPDGTPLADDVELTLSAGDSLLVTGPSGSGKSTLLRTISGIWPYAEGSVALPPDLDGKGSLFLSQKPYLPLGTLQNALAYPAAPESLSTLDWSYLLKLVQLSHLESRLQDEDDWSQVLSGGEQQRVALARVFVHRPRWLFLDEATSAQDEATEARLYEAIRCELPDTAICSVGHRPGLTAFHQDRLHFAAR